jgi:hypothetical protein
MSGIVVEWAPFSLAEGVPEAELIEASEALQSEFLARQTGFVKRELLRASEREWCDLVYWETHEAAVGAAAEAANSPVCLRYFHLMTGLDHTEPGAGVQHFAIRATYGV